MNIGLAVESVKDIISRASRTGEVRSSPELRAKRLAICKECKFYTGSTCKKCGCLMAIKTALIATNCPLGIWDVKMVEELAMGDRYDHKIDDHLYREACYEY